MLAPFGGDVVSSLALPPSELFDPALLFAVFLPLVAASTVSYFAYLNVLAELHRISMCQAYRVSGESGAYVVIPTIVFMVICFYASGL